MIDRTTKLLLPVCIVLIIIDQWTKQLATQLNSPWHPIPNLRLIWVQNTGSAFGWFHDWPYYSSIISVLTLIIVVYLTRQMMLHTLKYVKLGYTFIIAGALGNCLDRFIYGYVNDFIDIHFGSKHWFVFNLADAFITIGCLLIIINECYQRWRAKNTDII
ncbi:MAG: signal peptidase II [Candidatus Comchoanobacterales bacterium]